jgi:hypothetical protein
MNRAYSLCGAMLLLLSYVATPAQDNPAQEEKPAGLSGIATNGLTGEPLAHVEVSLLRRISGRFSSYRHTVTSPDGRFSLTGIESGSYFVAADRNGYHRVDVQLSQGPAMLALKPGEEIKNIVLKLEPDAIISGRAVDADGVPMERVKVQALGQVLTIPNDTDDRGEFVISGLPPGQYLLRASVVPVGLPEIRKDGSVTVGYGVTYAPSSRTVGGATSVTVRAGQESNIEIRMLPSPILHIRGSVLGETEDQQTRVILEDLWRESRTGRTDERGAFKFWGVPAGRYRIYAESWDSERRSPPVFINVTNASVDGVHLQMLPSVNLAGHIRNADWKQVASQITGDQDPLEITLTPVGLFPDIGYSCKLADDGGFELKRVAPGRYHLLMTKLPKNFYVKSLQLDDRAFQGNILEIGSPDKQEMLIEIGRDGAEVSGAVRDAKDGASQAVVFLLFDDPASSVAGVARTSADGSYVIHGIAPGKYKILALSANYADPLLTYERLELDRKVTERIEIHEGDKITQDLIIGPQ